MKRHLPSILVVLALLTALTTVALAKDDPMLTRSVIAGGGGMSADGRMPVAGVAVGGATSERVRPLHPETASFSDRFGDQQQLSPDGDAERYNPAVAYDSTHGEYLVVWYNVWPGGSQDIYARRVSATGQVLSWFCVTTGADRRMLPAVAYNAANDEYLVVWMQEASPATDVWQIWGRIIPWNAPGVNPDFLIMSWANRSFWTPKVAWNSNRNEYLVVWNAYDPGAAPPPGEPHDIAGYRVSAGGVVQNPGSPLLFTSDSSPRQVDVTYNVTTDEYWLAFVVTPLPGTTGDDIYGMRVSGNGTPVDPPGLIHICDIAQDQDAPAVATNRLGRYMVVWEHKYSPYDHDIYAREYNANGNPVQTSVTITDSPENSNYPDVAAINTDWLVVWEEVWSVPMSSGGTAIKMVPLGSGSVVQTYPLDVAKAGWWLYNISAVAAGRSNYMIAYYGHEAPDPPLPTTKRHIYGRVWWPNTLYLPLALR